MLVMDLLRFSIFPGSVLESCTFLRICPFLPRCPFYWHIIADSRQWGRSPSVQCQGKDSKGVKDLIAVVAIKHKDHAEPQFQSSCFIGKSHFSTSLIFWVWAGLENVVFKYSPDGQRHIVWPSRNARTAEQDSPGRLRSEAASGSAGLNFGWASLPWDVHWISKYVLFTDYIQGTFPVGLGKKKLVNRRDHNPCPLGVLDGGAW